MHYKADMATTRKLRIGIIGLGGIATRSHLPALLQIPEVIIQAGAEIDEYQANRTQQRFGIPKVYSDFQKMLDQEQLDAVYICLPNALHYQTTNIVLSHGLHAYCEKPVGLSAKEAQDLADQAEEANLILMPGYHLRFHKHFLRAKQLLEKRRLGKILQIQASAVFSGPYRGWDPKSDWHLDPRAGGPLYDWGSHLVDLLVYITNLDIEVVFAEAQRTLPGFPLMDNIVSTFQASRSIVGTLNIAWGARGNLLMLQIHGSAGSLVVSDDYFEHRTPTGGGLNKLGTLIGNTQDILKQRIGTTIRKKSVTDIYQKAAQHFIRTIRGELQIKKEMGDAVHVHHVLGAISASLEHGKPIKCGTLQENFKQKEA